MVSLPIRGFTHIAVHVVGIRLTVDTGYGMRIGIAVVLIPFVEIAANVRLIDDVADGVAGEGFI